MLAAASLLAGCASLAVKPEIAAHVPEAPAYLHPVSVAKPRKGESCVVVASREQGGRVKANVIIGDARRDWTAMRAQLAGEKTEGAK